MKNLSFAPKKYLDEKDQEKYKETEIKTKEQEEKEIEMFGITQNKLNAIFSAFLEISSKETQLISMLSDVQEMVERDMKEEARQTINQVKYLIDSKLTN